MTSLHLFNVRKKLSSPTAILVLPLTVVVVFCFGYILMSPGQSSESYSNSPFSERAPKSSHHLQKPSGSNVSPLTPASGRSTESTPANTSTTPENQTAPSQSAPSKVASPPVSQSVRSDQNNAHDETKNTGHTLVDTVKNVVPVPLVKDTLNKLPL